MWYSASLLFKSIHPHDPQADNLWEERVVLILADDPEEALEAAREYGEHKGIEYDTPLGGTVLWKFEEVLKVWEVLDDKLVHGAELFSRFLDDEQVISLKKKDPY